MYKQRLSDRVGNTKKIQPLRHVVYVFPYCGPYPWDIFVKCYCQNEFPKIFVSFQYINFYGGQDSLFDEPEDLRPKSVTEIVATMKQPKIEPGKTFLWENLKLRIPPLPPSRLAGCSIIDIRYYIKVSRLWVIDYIVCLGAEFIA